MDRNLLDCLLVACKSEKVWLNSMLSEIGPGDMMQEFSASRICQSLELVEGQPGSSGDSPLNIFTDIVSGQSRVADDFLLELSKEGG